MSSSDGACHWILQKPLPDSNAGSVASQICFQHVESLKKHPGQVGEAFAITKLHFLMLAASTAHEKNANFKKEGVIYPKGVHLISNMFQGNLVDVPKKTPCSSIFPVFFAAFATLGHSTWRPTSCHRLVEETTAPAQQPYGSLEGASQ